MNDIANIFPNYNLDCIGQSAPEDVKNLLRLL